MRPVAVESDAERETKGKAVSKAVALNEIDQILKTDFNHDWAWVLV